MGAEIVPAGGVHFRVWAPAKPTVEVVIEGGTEPACLKLAAEEDGYFAGAVESARAGSLYRYRVNGRGPFPDPASRFQPEGPNGPSQVIDPATMAWTDASWRGLQASGQVLYEMHVGTFTPEGSWTAAIEALPALRELGITAIEVMPVADFVGRFGWGYDGVNLFAPTWLYGTPDDFRRFVDRAHALGLGVILDVVYNHFGPEGCYLHEFASEYFTDRHQTEWGDALNFDGPGSAGVREFVLANACYWIEEFHLDGLRLDATQQIFDGSAEHIVNAVGRQARHAAEGAGRSILLVAENERQQSELVRPAEQGGLGLDAVWNEDFHHTAMVALTGRTDGYYSEYRGSPQEFVSSFKWGFLYQGQRYSWQHSRRGTPTFGLPPSSFVVYLQNHDQVANSLRSERFHLMTSPGLSRALTAVLLLAPGTPMLFQGQEYAASTPFHYFADYTGPLGESVRRGYHRFLRQFRSLQALQGNAHLTDPADPATYEQSKLDPSERKRHGVALALHRDLLKLRRHDAVFGQMAAGRLDGAVLGLQAFVVRYFGPAGADRLLVVNLGQDLQLDPAPEPLLAPPVGQRWGVLWSSEDLRYGGQGTPALETQQNWRIPGQAAVVLAPWKQENEPRA